MVQELSVAMEYELMWLSSICDENGLVEEGFLQERQDHMSNRQTTELIERYSALAEAGYIDDFGHAYNTVYRARLTDRGREKAIDILCHDMEVLARPARSAR